MRRTAGPLLVLGVLGLLVSCAPGEPKAGLSPNEPSPITQLVVTPPAPTVYTDGAIDFSVTAIHQDSTSSVPTVTWSATGGVITQGGVYTPGATAGNYSATASLVGSGLSQSADITILPVVSPIISITVSPSSTSLTTGGTRQFSATATRQDGSTAAPPVTWTATGGTISAGGLYTAGGTPGNYRVIAVQQAGSLADTSAVTVTAPVLQAVVLAPGSLVLATGGAQQFVVSGQWSDGATTAPAVTFGATGGTITSGGMYTAGSTPGSFRVVATQQGGTLADTAQVTITLPGPSSCSNKPASYTTVISDFNLSAPVPAGGNTERVIAGTPWSVIYDGDPNTGGSTSNFSLVSDPSAPMSPNGIWQLRERAGTWGDPPPGPNGYGWGNLGVDVPNVTKLYACWYTKWSNPFFFHPISHKYVNLFASNGQLFLVQLRHNEQYFEAADVVPGNYLTPQVNGAPSLNAWHRQELQVEVGNPGIVRIWIDGQLRTQYTNQPILPGQTISSFGLYGHLGGGGYTLPVDQYQSYDHIYIATP
jgi:hypothetical protein